MKTLYRLNFRTWSNGDEEHNYAIGVFSTHEEAAEIAQRYLREVKGFCDYACEYEILEYPLIGKRGGYENRKGGECAQALACAGLEHRAM